MIFSTLPSQQPFVYTWATKPPAAGNEGLEIIVSDIGNTKWKSDGVYWRPANGSTSLALGVNNVQTSSTSLQSVVLNSVTNIPFLDLISTPGMSITTEATFSRTNAASTQPHIVSIAIQNLTMAYFTATNTNPFKKFWGSMRNLSPTTFARSFSGDAITNDSGLAPVLLSTLTNGNSPIVVSAQVGSTVVSETIMIGSINIIFRA